MTVLPPDMPPDMPPDRGADMLPKGRFLRRNSAPHIVTLVALSGLSALAMNLFLPSLPGMADWFGTPYGVIQLSVSLYLLVSAVLQLLIGPISDRFGRRPVLLWSIALFLLATLGTLLAPSVEVFLVCRMFQAVIAAGMVLSRAIVRDMVPDAQAASMIGYVTMGMSLAPMVGPMIGGALDEAFGWQANFLLLMALGATVMALVWADLGETGRGGQASLGAQFRQYPALLASRRFWGYAVCAGASSGAFFSFLGGAPYVGTELFDLSPAILGFYFAAPSTGFLCGNFLSGRYSVRVGLVRMVLFGTIILTGALVCLAALSFFGLRGPNIFFGMMLFVGIGNGMTLPNATAGMMSVRPDLAGSASGLGGALAIGFGAGLAVLAGVVLSRGSTELPLVLLMLATSVTALFAIVAVIRRNRTLGI